MSLILRSLLRTPRTSVPALLLLALGLGGFAWMLALNRSLLLRSLTARDPGALVSLWNGDARNTSLHGTPSVGELEIMRAHGRSFLGVAAVHERKANLEGEQPEQVRVDAVTVDAFRVLGVTPALGRDFLPEEEAPGQGPVALLTHAAWIRRFGGDPGILARGLSLDGRSHRIVGVLPRGFHTPRGAEVFTPLTIGPKERGDFGAHYLRVFARLKPGATLAGARVDMDRVTAQIKELYRAEKAPPELVDRLFYGATPMIEEVLGQGAMVLRGLQGAALLVLLLAALNASALLLARALARRGEFALRSALGATSSRLLGHILGEGALLGLTGALLGLGLAWAGLGPGGRALAWAFPGLPMEGLSMDWTTVRTSLALGPLLGALCALPARPRADLAHALRVDGRSVVGSGGLLRRRLVIAQLALATALLGGAAWIHGGLQGLLRRDLGLRPEGVWTFSLSPTRDMRRDDARMALLQSQLLDEIRKEPGVEAAGILNNMPMSGWRSDLNIRVPGDPEPRDPEARAISPGALSALGLRLLKGRDFTEADVPGAPPVVLLTRGLARACFGEADPIGRQILIDGPATVVGVVEDYREFGPSQPAPPTFFLPFAQGAAVNRHTLHVALRMGGSAPSRARLQALVNRVAPGVAVTRLVDMDTNLRESLGPQRMARAFLGLFALLALLLALGGVYGLTVAALAQRRGEFGLRNALGATPGDLLAMVLHETARLALAGGILGLALGFLLRQGGERWAGGLAPPGPLPPLGAFAGLIATALLATLPSAWRAARVDPASSLRAE